jgi:large subunit ribosomal protein L5e
MVFVKVQKNKAYFKRFQTKYRRRREGKTDYRARQALITQDKTKYNAPKYRFVVRITNTDVITQIVSSQIIGDKVHCAAYSHELPRYGLKVGLTNYAAAYATGLLLARRLLQQIGLDTKYAGITSTDGKDYLVESDKSQDQRPFRANLDVGLARTTTGAKIFGALKGACDGGLHIPHSTRRFPGFKKSGEKQSYDPKVHRDRIYGIHVANWMKKLQEDNEELYQRQFSKFIKEGVKADDLENLYKKVHAAIRADPKRVASKNKDKKYPRYNRVKLTRKVREDRIAAKKQKLLAKIAASE